METRWEITRNGYKPPMPVISCFTRSLDGGHPFCCGTSTGASAEAAISIELVDCSQAFGLPAIAGPKSGLQSKVQFRPHLRRRHISDGLPLWLESVFPTQRASSRPTVVLAGQRKSSGLRRRGMQEDKCPAAILSAVGRQLRESGYEHEPEPSSIPMSDEHLKAKFRQNPDHVLGVPGSHEIIEKVGR